MTGGQHVSTRKDLQTIFLEKILVVRGMGVLVSHDISLSYFAQRGKRCLGARMDDTPWDCFLPVASVQAYKFMAVVYAGQLNKQRLSKPPVSQVNPRIGMYCR